MFLQDAPADTANYMILGFGVILGLIGLYLVSLATRWRNAQRDLRMLEEIEGKQPRTP
ncbi:MAG: hypothetical protein HW375_2209 [Anaerolineales bacterium]|jgi:hypothetical protein|nr:hypothetical protein [Anaerolineales bacterium]